MTTLLICLSLLLHFAAIILSIKVVQKYESNLKDLCPSRSFNPFKYEAVRFWTILLSLIVSMGFLYFSLQLLVAKGVIISIQYLLLDIGAAVLNINYLIMLLLEKRKI